MHVSTMCPFFIMYNIWCRPGNHETLTPELICWLLNILLLATECYHGTHDWLYTTRWSRHVNMHVFRPTCEPRNFLCTCFAYNIFCHLIVSENGSQYLVRRVSYFGIWVCTASVLYKLLVAIRKMEVDDKWQDANTSSFETLKVMVYSKCQSSRDNCSIEKRLCKPE